MLVPFATPGPRKTGYMWSLTHHSSDLRAQKSLFFSPEFPVQPVITWHPSPPPHFALWGRKQSSSDVLYGPSRLGRNQDVLLGAGMIVSALAGRFVSLQVISWMDNDRYTFPAIFHFCRRGSEKHGTLWPRGHLCKQASRLPKLAAPRSGWHKDTFSQLATRPRGDPATLWMLGSVSGGCKSGKLGGWGAGWWGNIEEATLDFWRVRWTLMGRRSRRMRRWWGGRRGTGRRMACGRGHSFDLWFFNFSELWRLQSIPTAAEGKEGKGWEGGTWRGVEVERWSRSFDSWLVWLMPKDITPRKKCWPLDWSCVLLHVWQAGAIWPPFVWWRQHEEGSSLVYEAGNIPVMDL